MITYKLNSGSGMGGMMSCELCDDVFFEIAERDFALCPLVQARYQFSSWIRFRDDIFCLFSSALLFTAFLKELRQRIHKLWKLKVEEVGSHSVSMLDLKVSIPDRQHRCKLTWKPYFKPSSKAVPLATSSCHFTAVCTQGQVQTSRD